MIPLNEPSHPAQQAAFNSVKNVCEKNKRGWLALFADNAVVQDPVGVSMLDPSGAGHRGKIAIAAFWDMVIEPGQLEVKVRESYPCGNECANVATMTNTMQNGMVIKVDLVIVYRVDAAGKIESLKAYWDFAGAMERAAEMMS